MVQAKAKRRGSSVRKFLAGVRRGYLPWMAQNLRNLHSNAVGSALSTMREVRISRHRPRRLERQGPMFEILEPRLLLSALPTPFATINIGSPAMADSAIYVSANNQWQVTGAGAGINGHADHFSYTAENWTGSGSLTADVGTVADTGANAQAGVMIRDTSAASSDFAAVMENPNGTISLEYRNGYGSSVIVSTTSTAINLAWVRLSETQSGNTDSFTGLYSTDGVNWTAINATPIGMTFTQSTNLAGLAVASGNPSQSQAVNFNSFSATPTNFTDQGIGTPSIAGSSTYDPSTGNWTVKGGGADIYGSGDQFNFALGFTTYVAAETVDPEPQPAYVDLAQFNWQTNYSATMTNGSWQIAAGSGFSPAGAGAFTLANPGSFVPITSGTAANIAFANETWD